MSVLLSTGSPFCVYYLFLVCLCRLCGSLFINVIYVSVYAIVLSFIHLLSLLCFCFVVVYAPMYLYVLANCSYMCLCICMSTFCFYTVHDCVFMCLCMLGYSDYTFLSLCLPLLSVFNYLVRGLCVYACFLYILFGFVCVYVAVCMCMCLCLFKVYYLSVCVYFFMSVFVCLLLCVYIQCFGACCVYVFTLFVCLIRVFMCLLFCLPYVFMCLLLSCDYQCSVYWCVYLIVCSYVHFWLSMQKHFTITSNVLWVVRNLPMRVQTTSKFSCFRTENQITMQTHFRRDVLLYKSSLQLLANFKKHFFWTKAQNICPNEFKHHLLLYIHKPSPKHLSNTSLLYLWKQTPTQIQTSFFWYTWKYQPKDFKILWLCMKTQKTNKPNNFKYHLLLYKTSQHLSKWLI